MSNAALQKKKALAEKNTVHTGLVQLARIEHCAYWMRWQTASTAELETLSPAIYTPRMVLHNSPAHGVYAHTISLPIEYFRALLAKLKSTVLVRLQLQQGMFARCILSNKEGGELTDFATEIPVKGPYLAEFGLNIRFLLDVCKHVTDGAYVHLYACGAMYPMLLSIAPVVPEINVFAFLAEASGIFLMPCRL